MLERNSVALDVVEADGAPKTEDDMSIRMKKYLSILVTVILVAVLCGPVMGRGRLANSGRDGLRFYTIDKILRLKDDQIDIGTAALLLSRKWSNAKSVHRYRGKLDDMAADILKQLKKKGITRVDYRAVAVINDYLYNEIGFRSIATADDPEDLFLHNVLDTRRGYCLSLSVLYLAIAERIGLELHGVVVPGHFFVRYDDGKKRFNIETTSMGRTAPDSHYIEKFKAPKRTDSLYMANLTKRQTLGCFFNNLGNSYSTVGDIDNAQLELERAVRVNPALAEAHTNLGNIYLKKGWSRDAISHYLTALKISDSDPKTHNNLANAYGYVGQFAQAVSQYRKAIELQPDFVDAYRNLAGTYLRNGQMKKAIAELKHALRLKHDDSDSFLLLGDVYQRMKDYNAAIHQYTRAAQLAPQSTSAHTNLAYCYYNTDRFDTAVSHFGRAIQLDPSNTGAYFGLALTYNGLGLTDNEIDVYRELLTIEPGITAALQNLGNAYVVLELYEDAAEQYRRAIQLEPNDSGLYYNLGVAYANLEYYEDAAGEYLAAIGIDGRNAPAHNAAAISFYMLKDYDSARYHARIAKELGFDVQKELLDALGK